MFHVSAFVSLADKSGIDKLDQVDRKCFKIAVQSLCDLFDGYSFFFVNQKKNGNSPMIGNAFQVTLHLLRGLRNPSR